MLLTMIVFTIFTAVWLINVSEKRNEQKRRDRERGW